MNEKSNVKSSETKPQLTRVTRLLCRAQDSLHGAFGAAPSYKELQEWTGVAEGTIKYWFNNQGRPPAEFVFQLLERIPERQRHEILNSVCRVYPALEDARLNFDQTIISRLKTIVCQPSGLVVIQGGSDESRTFLLTAMGFAFLRLTARPHRVVGLDAHEPDWFVPLPGVQYLGNLFQPARLLDAARNAWPRIDVGRSQLVVLNALGVIMANFQKSIKALTARCPVIIAEAAPVKPSLLKAASHGLVHILTIPKHPESVKGLGLVIETV